MLHPHLELFPKAINRLRHIENILLEYQIKATRAGTVSDTAYDRETEEFLGQNFGYTHFVESPNMILTWACFVSTGQESDQIGDMHVQVDLGFRECPKGEFIAGFIVKYNEIKKNWSVAYESTNALDEPITESERGVAFADHFVIGLNEQREISKKEAYIIIRHIALYFAADAAGNQ